MTETIKAQLSLLYQVGKVDLPERAGALADSLAVLAESHAAWAAPTVRAGSPAVLTRAMSMNETVHGLLRRAVLSCQDASVAMVAIADDLVATDGEAADAARGLRFTLDDLPTPATPEPPPLDGAHG